MLKKYLLLFIVISLVSISHAGDLSYDCTIKRVYDIDDVGMFKTSGWQGKFEGGRFSVSRETGEITGQTLTTVLAKNTRVINTGSKDNSKELV